MKRLVAGALLGTLAVNAHALSMGDLAFTAFNADMDNWAVVNFVDLAPNTNIYFSDNEWNGTAFNDFNEHTLLWNTGPTTIAAGTVVLFTEIDAAIDTITASIGTLGLAAGGGTNLGLSASADTLYAYLGTSAAAPTTFLTAVSSEGITHLTPAGLTAGTNAVVLTNSTDFGQYTGVRTGLTSFAAYRPLINNPANWFIDTANDYSLTNPNVTAFAAVPEAETWLMLAVGLGLTGLVRRRRA